MCTINKISVAMGFVLFCNLGFVVMAGDVTATGDSINSKGILSINKTTEKISVDGKMEETAWQTAEILTLGSPVTENGIPVQKTEARIIYDDKYIYVIFKADDIDIEAKHHGRDQYVFQDDCLEIFLNPSPEKTDIYCAFEMNVNLALNDCVIIAEGKDGKAFSIGAYDPKGVKIAVSLNGTLNNPDDTDKYWMLEAAIPFTAFEGYNYNLPPKKDTIWKFQLSRWDRGNPNGKNSLSVYTPTGMIGVPHKSASMKPLIFK